jgi:hypothetical protein
MARSRIPTAERLAKERSALELAQAGVSFDVIAQELGYANRGGAYKVVQAALARVNAGPAAELKAMQHLRLERLHHAVWAKALKGDLAAADRVLRISESLRRLHGLDAPARHDHRISGELDATIEALSEELAGGMPAPVGHDG